MQKIECTVCGGQLKPCDGSSLYICENCGSIQPASAVSEERITELYNRANKLRMNADFERAASFYKTIIKDFPKESAAFWGLCLCKYGVVYVAGADGACKPTVHRASFEKMLNDALYKSALDCAADDNVKCFYRDKAKEIDRIMGEILLISREEKPCDIFICYKETDKNGERTPDSVLAQDIYSELTRKGYNVFFSRITLREKLGTQYEPYIFAALNSARLMLAVGTDYEYYNSVWVKNEWQRFLGLAQNEKSKQLVPCFKDMEPDDFPDEFKGLENQNMALLGAMQELLFFIDRFFGRDKKAKPSDSAAGDAEMVEVLLERAFMLLGKKEWKATDETCEKILEFDTRCAKAYLCKLLAELHIDNEEALSEVSEPFDKKYNCIKLCEFAPEYREKIIVLNCSIRERKETERKQKIYDDALKKAVAAKTESDFKFVAESFKKIAGFKDAGKLAVKYANKAQTLRKDEIYHNAEAQMAKDNSCAYTEAIKLFGEIPGYKDSGERIAECINKTAELKLAAAREKTEESGKKGKKRKVRKILITAVCLLTVINMFLVYFFSPYFKYIIWDDIAAVSAGEAHTVGLKTDGTVVAVKTAADNDDVEVDEDEEKNIKNDYGQCEVGEWTDIVAVSAGGYHTVGLKSDGTVVACGCNNDGQCEVGEWTDIVAVSAGGYHTVGLKSDGTVVACGNNVDGRGDVGKWTDIVAVSAGGYHTVGLKSDGTVVACGCNGEEGRCNVGKWKDIIAVSAGKYHTVGLKSDGTAVACGFNNFVQCDVGEWKDIVAVAAGGWHTVGLKSDGTVIACGYNGKNQLDVGEWENITAVSAGAYHTVGMKSNGRVVCRSGEYFSKIDNTVSKVLSPFRRFFMLSVCSPDMKLTDNCNKWK